VRSARAAALVAFIAALVATVVPAGGLPIAASIALLSIAALVAEVASRERSAGVSELVFSQPGEPNLLAPLKVAAAWGAALLATSPLVLRLLFGAPERAAALVLGLGFVAATATGAGLLVRQGRLFLGAFVVLWYAAVSGLPGADFAGLFVPAGALGRAAAYAAGGAAFAALGQLGESARARR